MSSSSSTSPCPVCGEATLDQSFACNRYHARFGTLRRQSEGFRVGPTPADELMDAMQCMSLAHLPIKSCEHYPGDENARAAHVDCKKCGVCDPISSTGEIESIIELLESGATCWMCGFAGRDQVANTMNTIQDFGSRMPVQQSYDTQILRGRQRQRLHPAATAFSRNPRAHEVAQRSRVVRAESLEALNESLLNWPPAPAPGSTRGPDRQNRSRQQTRRRLISTASRVTKPARGTQTRFHPLENTSRLKPTVAQNRHRLHATRRRASRIDSITQGTAGRLRRQQLASVAAPAIRTSSQQQRLGLMQGRMSSRPMPGMLQVGQQYQRSGLGSVYNTEVPRTDAGSVSGTVQPVNIESEFADAFGQMSIGARQIRAPRRALAPMLEEEDEDDDEMEM